MAVSPYFSRVWAVPYSTGGVAVQWRMNPSSGLSGSSFTFKVYRGITGGEWEYLGTVVDDTVYIDEDLPIQLEENLRDGWYMVTVTDNGTEYESDQVPLTGQLSPLEWRIVRESMRAHTRLTETYCGISGWLFRRLTSGERCSCYDTDLGGVVDSTCASCYGTGWLGGYHDALAFTMIPTARGTGKIIRTVTEAGVRDDNMQFLCQAVPLVHAEDVWMNGVTGEHYKVTDLQVAKAIRGVPIAYNCVLAPVSPGDIADKLMPEGYTAPSWTGDVDTTALATLRITVEEDIDLDYEEYIPDGESDAVDMNNVTPVFEIFDSEEAMNTDASPLLTVSLTATANESVWTVASTVKLNMYLTLEDVEALGAGDYYYRTTFTYSAEDEIIEFGPLIIEAV